MKTILILFALLNLFCGNKFVETQYKTSSDKTAKDTCDGPDSDIGCSFIKAPSGLKNEMMIPAQNEPGQKIRIEGKILKSDSITPYPGVLIYAYHTDAGGLYSKSGNETGFQKWHGKLHGWCITDNDGKYFINTVRPGKYPEGDFPAHIHWAVKEPIGKMQYLNDFVFSDDKDVNEDYLSKLYYRGDAGVITLTDSDSGYKKGSRVTVLD